MMQRFVREYELATLARDSRHDPRVIAARTADNQARIREYLRTNEPRSWYEAAWQALRGINP